MATFTPMPTPWITQFHHICWI